MRYDGELFYVLARHIGVPAGTTEAMVGNVVHIDTGTADYTSPGDDGIPTYVPMATVGRHNKANGRRLF